MREPSPNDKKGRKRSMSNKRRKKQPPRQHPPNTEHFHSIHQQHHAVRAMKEHRHMLSYKNIMKEYQDKVASINFRKDALDRARNANYQNEYHRLRGHLEHTVVRGVQLERLNQRIAELKGLIQEGL